MIKKRAAVIVMILTVLLAAGVLAAGGPFLQIEQLPGYVPGDKLENAEYITRKSMTYRESINQGARVGRSLADLPYSWRVLQ